MEIDRVEYIYRIDGAPGIEEITEALAKVPKYFALEEVLIDPDNGTVSIKAWDASV